jgi:hypothetical protein
VLVVSGDICAGYRHQHLVVFGSMQSYQENYGTTIDRGSGVDVDTFHPRNPSPEQELQEKRLEPASGPLPLPAPTKDDSAINLTSTLMVL